MFFLFRCTRFALHREREEKGKKFAVIETNKDIKPRQGLLFCRYQIPTNILQRCCKNNHRWYIPTCRKWLILCSKMWNIRFLATEWQNITLYRTIVINNTHLRFIVQLHFNLKYCVNALLSTIMSLVESFSPDARCQYNGENESSDIRQSTLFGKIFLGSFWFILFFFIC